MFGTSKNLTLLKLFYDWYSQTFSIEISKLVVTIHCYLGTIALVLWCEWFLVNEDSIRLRVGQKYKAMQKSREAFYKLPIPFHLILFYKIIFRPLIITTLVSKSSSFSSSSSPLLCFLLRCRFRLLVAVFFCFYRLMEHIQLFALILVDISVFREFGGIYVECLWRKILMFLFYFRKSFKTKLLSDVP